MNSIIQLFHEHPVWLSIAGTWFVNNVITAAIASFSAPTKDSSPGYVWWFKFSNTVIGNLRRAHSTAIESSPNWQDAVQKHLEQQQSGGPQVAPLEAPGQKP